VLFEQFGVLFVSALERVVQLPGCEFVYLVGHEPELSYAEALERVLGERLAL